ncbi:Fatty acid-binding -like protein 5 [Toxocara canis]|uniref:Fatty acid-binding-like protein 5 n=1 Tax=Toxocara canis TaxID=6265 RepID=A0A0B2UZF6_TOXCA|nr:Fatty acid-binding -like protein 5 [Toxocara canis]
MSELFVGEWDLEFSENFAEYLEDVGVNPFLRAIATSARPTICISIEDGKWTIKTKTAMRTLVLEFRLDEEFEDCTPDGRQMISIVRKIDDRRLEQRQQPKKKGQVASLITRYIDDEGHFVVELCALKQNGHTARRVHRKRLR